MSQTIMSTKTTSIATILIFSFFSVVFVTADNTDSASFSETLNPQTLGLLRQRETLTHLHFYFHDSVNGKNPTTVSVAKAAAPSEFYFGAVSVMDDPLTVNNHRSSKQVGSAQGIYAEASQTEFGLLMALNFVFTEGKFNGSTLSIFGRNALYSAVREIPIVGGTGIFRFARGYVEARTSFFNTTTLDAIVECDVYVFH